MTPTESLGKHIAGLRPSKPDWHSYFAPTGWIRNGIPDKNLTKPHLTIDDGMFTTVETIKGTYSEVTFVNVSLWFQKTTNSKSDAETANAISKDIAASLHEAITAENVRIQVQGRNPMTDINPSLGRVRISLRLMELS